MNSIVRIAVPILLALFLVVLLLDVGRLVMAPTRDASVDAVRIRNALVADLGDPAETDWRPEAVPSNYNWESRPAPAYFVRLADEIVPPEARGEPTWARAVRLARHLRQNGRRGKPLQANTRETYEKIVSGQGGYCSDYTQSFNALALAAGLKVREWGFAWPEMANGHAFNEVWDPDLEKWIFIDSFISFYVVDRTSGTPMSALEFQSELLSGARAGEIEVVPILAERFGFKSPEKALDWYRRGVPRMFLLLGNNIFSYDANPIIRAAEALPRSVEMLVAIVLGEHPRFLFVPPASQAEVGVQVEEMRWEVIWIVVKLVAILVLGVSLLVALWRLLRQRIRQPTAA